jgi:tyrosyl-tRNA synthetase
VCKYYNIGLQPVFSFANLLWDGRICHKEKNMPDMTLSEELQWRGLIKDRTFNDVTWLDTPRTFYLGADAASADSLTIGNLAIYMLARQLAVHGWKTVLLVGGATSLIGDPGGKEEERQLKSKEEVAHNVASVKAQVEKIFAGLEFETVNNYDWFKDIGFLEFLRDVGKHYSMTELVQRDFIATRMHEGGSGISYAEFSYNLIQGYDFWWLYKNKGVELQIGGSDQWGNMLSGAPLVRKKEGKEVHALSMPLVINKATGKKFGKSEAGAVWLDPAKTSPTQFYQFWINCDDQGVEDYLKIYTMLPKGEIEQIIAQHRENPKQRSAQTRLAQEVTKLVHGDAELVTAQTVTEVLTGNRPVAELDDAALTAMRREIPSMHAQPGAEIIELLAQSGLAGSKTEARRLLHDNAVSLNGAKTQKESLEEQDFQNGRLLLRKGKAFKDSALVERG